VQVVGGSNPLAPTKEIKALQAMLVRPFSILPLITIWLLDRPPQSVADNGWLFGQSAQLFADALRAGRVLKATPLRRQGGLHNPINTSSAYQFSKIAYCFRQRRTVQERMRSKRRRDSPHVFPDMYAPRKKALKNP
jgi:hypothetical protein